MKLKLILSLLCSVTLMSCGNGYDAELEAATVGKDANVSFHMVHSASDDRATLAAALEKGVTRPGTIVRPYPEFGTSLIIEERTEIDQDCLKSVKAGQHPDTNMPILNFRFDDRCTKLFGKLTSQNVGKRFAVVIDDVIVTAPNIRTAITGGSGFIEGGFTEEGVRELAYIINRSNRQRRKAKSQ